MKLINCELIDLRNLGTGYSAVVWRHDNHEVLGPPKPGKATMTSMIKFIDFERGIIVTQNTIYKFGG